MSKILGVKVPDSIISPISSMANADFPSDAQWKAAARESGNTGRFLMDKTIRDDGYALIQFMLDNDPGVAKWCDDTKRDHLDALPVIAITVGENAVRLCCHGLIGDPDNKNMSLSAAMEILQALGWTNPNVPKERVKQMSPEVVSVYGIFGTVAYVDLTTDDNKILLNMKPTYRQALSVALGQASVIVSLCRETEAGEDVTFLGLADYALIKGRFHRVISQ